MKIGVDAGALGVSDDRLKMGVYQVNRNLLRLLGQLDHSNEYILYSFAPIDREVMKEYGPRMKNVVLAPRTGWSTVWLPFALARNPVDVFLGLSQSLPYSKSHNIGFIYDLGFLHYPEAYPTSYEKLKNMTKNLVARADRIVTISDTVKRDIFDTYGYSQDDIVVAFPGIDKMYSRFGSVYKGEHPYFLFVGALKPGKNIPILLRAFARFCARVSSSIDLNIIGGDYWKDPAIEHELVHLKIQARTKFLGYVPEADLPAYYRGAIAFMSPSLYEGFCMPAANAVACGRPVIGSTTGAFKEIVGSCGIFVDPTDVSALAQAMYDIRNKKIQYQDIQKKYSWEACAGIVLSEIQKFRNKQL